MSDPLSIASAALAAAWVAVCNTRTHAQRAAMLPSVSDPRFEEKLSAFHKISYVAHLWMLCTFRDPMKLYCYVAPLQRAA